MSVKKSQPKIPIVKLQKTAQGEKVISQLVAKPVKVPNPKIWKGKRQIARDKFKFEWQDLIIKKIEQELSKVEGKEEGKKHERIETEEREEREERDELMMIWQQKWPHQLEDLQKIRKRGMKLKKKGQLPKSNCSARVIPYFIDKKGNIILILVKVRDYQDWTAMGGKCVEIEGDCGDINDDKLLECLRREVIEESHFAIDDEDLLIRKNEHCFSVTYRDDSRRWNNLRFSLYVGDPDLIKDRFYNEELLKHLETLQNSRDYLETVELEFFPLETLFYNYAWNTYYRRGLPDQRIDYSLLNGLYSGMNLRVSNPNHLVKTLSYWLRDCEMD